MRLMVRRALNVVSRGAANSVSFLRRTYFDSRVRLIAIMLKHEVEVFDFVCWERAGLLSWVVEIFVPCWIGGS